MRLQQGYSPTGSGDTFSGSPSASASPLRPACAFWVSRLAPTSSSSSSNRSSAKIIPSDEFLKDYKIRGDVSAVQSRHCARYVEPTDLPAKNVPIPVIDTVTQRTVSLEGAWELGCCRRVHYDVQRRPTCSTLGSGPQLTAVWSTI